MPILTYQQDEQSQGLPTPYSGAQVSPGAAGAGAAQGLEQLGEQGLTSALAAKEEIRVRVKAAKDKADTVAIEDGYTRAQGSLNSRIFDPKTGYVGLKGTDAAPPPGTTIDAAHPAPIDQYLQGFNKDIDGVMSGLANDDQRRELGWRIARLKETGTRAALQHEQQQQQVVGAAVHAGGQDEAVRHASIVAANPNATLDDLRAPLAEIVENSNLRAKGLYGQSATNEMIKAVALPDLQRAAVAAMSSAVNAPGVGPQRAKQLFDLYGDLLGQHRGQFERVVSQLQVDSGDAQAAQAALQPALTPLMLPGSNGPSVVKIDHSKLSLEGLSPASIKMVEQRVANYEKAFHQNVSQVASDALTEGRLPDGSFSLAQVSADKRVWLQVHGAMTENGVTSNAYSMLQQLENREDASARALARAADAETRRVQAETQKGNAGAAWNFTHSPENKAQVLGMTRAQFGQTLIDDTQYPGGLSLEGRQKALADFDKLQKEASLPESAQSRVVSDALEKAFPGVGAGPKKNRDKAAGALADLADAYAAKNKGNIDEGKLRDYIEHELATIPAESFFSSSPGRFFERDIGALQASRVGAAAGASVAAPSTIPPQPTKASSVAPSPKTIRSYKYTPDRKQRAPVFSDGSQGPLEAAQ